MADAEKKLSVIVPCYKVERYLPRCLDSLVDQTLDGVEVICINDGSPDGCLDIIKDYRRRYPDVITLIDKPNEGVWRGRWDGIRIARGEYIGFVDSDDYVERDFAEVLYNTAKQSDADIAVCGFRRIDLESGKVLSREMCKKRPPFSVKSDAGRIVELNGAPWNKCFRAGMLRKVRDLRNPPPVFDDIAFHLLAYCVCEGDIVFAGEPLVNYLVRSGSIINSITLEQVDAAFEAFREVKERYLEEKAPDALVKALDAAAFLHFGISLTFRLSCDSAIDIREQIRKHTRFLDDVFPTWSKSPYINFRYARTRGGAFWKLLFAQKAYKAHLLPPLLTVYRFVIERLGKDIKW